LLQILLYRLVQQIALLRASRRRTLFAGPWLGDGIHAAVSRGLLPFSPLEARNPAAAHKPW
jgi:hypothetical protein